MLKEILAIPTFSGREELMGRYVAEFGKKNGFETSIDKMGNVYLTKGCVDEGAYYPCVIAHLDTVHSDQVDLVDKDARIVIEESNFFGKKRLNGMDPFRSAPTGIGGDNKCGVYIALKLMLEFDCIKAAFFVEEEIGMNGSKNADDDFFSDVGYALQFDAPTRNWFSSKLMGLKLWNEQFFEVLCPVLNKHHIDNITDRDPFTDVLQIRKKYKLCCAVMPTGYYNQHSRHEYVIPEETEECVSIGIDSIRALGSKKYTMD